MQTFALVYKLLKNLRRRFWANYSCLVSKHSSEFVNSLLIPTLTQSNHLT